MILSGKTIQRLGIMDPCHDRTLDKISGMTFGLSMAGYDLTIDQEVTLVEGRTVLASSTERFKMPKNVVGIVHDKSSFARRGVFVQNTVIEPGWEGFLTLEISYMPLVTQEENRILERYKRGYTIVPPSPSLKIYGIHKGCPVAQVVFHFVDCQTEGYGGKYQNQERGPQHAR